MSDTSQMTCFYLFSLFSEKESGVLGAGTGAGTIKGNAGIKRNSPGITGDSPGSSTRDLRPGSRRYRDEEQKQQRVRSRFLGEWGVLL